jgi:hypothetical protein
MHIAAFRRFFIAKSLELFKNQYAITNSASWKAARLRSFREHLHSKSFFPDAPHYGVQNSGIKQKSDAARHIPSGMRICDELAGV